MDVLFCSQQNGPGETVAAPVPLLTLLRLGAQGSASLVNPFAVLMFHWTISSFRLAPCVRPWGRLRRAPSRPRRNGVVGPGAQRSVSYASAPDLLRAFLSVRSRRCLARNPGCSGLSIDINRLVNVCRERRAPVHALSPPLWRRQQKPAAFHWSTLVIKRLIETIV